MPSPRTYTRPSTSVPQFPAIALERTPAADDTDTATRQTIAKMCELIRDSVDDPEVQRVALYIKDRFAQGSDDPAALAWGVFWWMKHSIKFRTDEATMFHVGQRDEQDLLISPAVLVRMKDPSEDCDGFTMLAAALLTALDVPVLIATVATDMEDPSRWSHVFLCAIVNGRTMPLDTSHGAAPGWMVPKSRINRWQTWKLDGSKADVPIPTYHGLHGYVRTGMGQTNWGGPPPIIGRPIFPGGGVRPVRKPMPILVTPPSKRSGMGQVTGQCATSTCIVWNGPDEDGAYSCDSYDNSSCNASPINTNPFPTATPPGPTTTIPLNTPLTPAQAGLTAQQQAALIAAVGSSTVSLIRTATGGPYTVAGTNLVYNPATGQLSSAANPYGLNLSTLNLSSLTSYIPLVGGILIFAWFMGRK